MFNRIHGLLSEKTLSSCSIETGGIEWDITVSATTASQLPDPGKEVSLYTVLIHREDQMSLYGFFTDLERKLFLNLIKVNGLGPKQAIKILSRAKPQDIIELLNTGNADLFSQIPGIGLKTAQKIILSLKGKVITESPTTGKASEIVTALVEMGFERRNALKAVESLISQFDSADLEIGSVEQQLFKQAIVILSS